MKNIIWWIRRDLRLKDNWSLRAAATQGAQVLPVFILDPRILDSPRTGAKRLNFLLGGLNALRSSLEKLGGKLIIRSGHPEQVLKILLEESGAEMIFAEADTTPFARKRDESIAKLLPIKYFGSPAIQPPGSILKSDGTPYTVFTPFSKAWKSQTAILENDTFLTREKLTFYTDITSEDVPPHSFAEGADSFVPGEDIALQRLRYFLADDNSNIYSYADNRNRLDLDGTSRLSPYIRFGMVSPHYLAHLAVKTIENAPDNTAQKGAETWLNELIWRDFYIHILYHFPRVRKRNFRLENVRWENNKDNFEAWCNAQTGYPVIDAAIRQLTQTGWMHNRARMIVASFLTKDLLIDWRWGEHFFMQHLIDGDPSSNNGGWQWTAGTGTDAAPYFRIFNPVTQAKKFDPFGNFVRKWIPELFSVPTEYIHSPWELSLQQQKTIDVKIGETYPAPIIDHAWARERVLSVFAQAK
ncbi:MAG: deoxyribodipyrimidine photo-lyase [Anaerolineales bacterium]|nr:MAG: deoxyribodipyrimidine photo-lyase [Anaerolineales bacterium]